MGSKANGGVSTLRATFGIMRGRFFGGLFVVVTTALACASQTNDGTCSKTTNGKECVQDADCCSTYCKPYADVGKGFCQARIGQPACAEAGGFCTQNPGCCSGLCSGGLCFGTPPQPGGCDELGSTCVDSAYCCTGVCKANLCASPTPFDAGACNAASAACFLPSDCCSGLCAAGTCLGQGGTGGTCGKSGSICRTGADCCSRQCQKLSGSSQCR